MKHLVFAILLVLSLFSPRAAVARETAASPDSANIVRGISIQNGYLWCPTPSGVIRWNTTDMNAVRYTVAEGLGSNDISAVNAYYDGTVLAGAGRRVYLFNTLANTWAEVPSGEGLPGVVTSILIHPECMYCVSTDQGVCRYTSNSWGLYTTAEGLADNNVRQLFSAPDGTVWFATAGGVSHYDLVTWTSWTVTDGLSSNNVRTVTVDSEGAVWVGTDAGVSRFDGSTWKNFSFEDGLADTDVRAIAVAPDKSVWAGTAGGIYRFTGLAWEKSNAPGVPSEPIRAIAADANGTVWAGTYRGLYQYTGVVWTLYLPNSIQVAAEEPSALPEAVSILGNYPNPFNPETIIEFSLPKEAVASVSVYSVTGQRIRTLASGPMSPGAHSLRWDGRDDSGRAVSSGAYIAEVRAGNVRVAHRMMMVR